MLIEREQVLISPLELPKKKIENPFLANKRVIDEVLGRGINLYG